MGDERFQEKLEHLQQSILTMASLAERNLSNAIEGLINRDLSLAEDAINKDEEVDQLEKSIQKEGLQILVEFQPEGYAMRRVTGTLQVSSELERVSDQAVTIGRRARTLIENPPGPIVQLVEPIYEMAEQMLESSIRCFIQRDVTAALALEEADNELDELHRRVIDRVLGEMKEHPAFLRSLFHFTTIVRSLERVGDHSVNISEHTVFIESGKDIRHGGREDLE